MSKKRTKVATISILLILGTLTAIYLGYKNDIFTKEVINLVCSENKISWYIKDDMDLKDGYFVLYRNGIEVYKGDKTEYTDNPVEDYEAPEDVKSININYEIDKIILDWDAALDKGSDNRFKVYFVNRNGIKILRSNENTYNYSSGISKYIVNIGESTFETDSNKLEVNREDLGSGVLDTSVIALDNRGN